MAVFVQSVHFEEDADCKWNVFLLLEAEMIRSDLRLDQNIKLT